MHTDFYCFRINNTNTAQVNDSDAVDIQTEAIQLYAVSMNNTMEVRSMVITSLYTSIPSFHPPHIFVIQPSFPLASLPTPSPHLPLCQPPPPK